MTACKAVQSLFASLKATFECFLTQLASAWKPSRSLCWIASGKLWGEADRLGPRAENLDEDDTRGSRAIPIIRESRALARPDGKCWVGELLRPQSKRKRLKESDSKSTLLKTSRTIFSYLKIHATLCRRSARSPSFAKRQPFLSTLCQREFNGQKD